LPSDDTVTVNDTAPEETNNKDVSEGFVGEEP
jgi:hypothetical protein